MKSSWIVLVFLSLIIALQATPRFVARIDNPTPQTLIRFQNQAYDVCAYHPGQYLDLLLTDTLYQELKSEFPSLHITQTEAQVKSNLRAAEKDIPGYRSYQEMVDELMLLQAQHPSLIQVSSIGTGWGAVYNAQNIAAYQNFGHQLWAVKLSDNVNIHEDEPAFYFVGEHHAREPISLETVMGILNHLLEGYGTDSIRTEMIDSSEIWFVPLLNPDGHKIVIDQTDVWWRKNLHDNNNNHTIETGSGGEGADGIDLNRNYGYKWGYLSASDNPSDITYHGTEAFSELETQAFKTLLDEHKFIAGISYHTYGQYVLYPFGYMYDIISPDQQELQDLANNMATAITAAGGSTYTPMHSYELYPVSGNLDDWAYGTYGTFAYTIEMATQFIPPATQVPTIVQSNIPAAMALLSRKNTKTLKGHVTNAYTGKPLTAMVFVQGIDDSILKTNQSWTDGEFGSFYRFLPVGLHQVSFICPGYQSEVMTVQISDDSATELDVALIPVEPIDLLINIYGANAYPLQEVTLSFPDLDGADYVSTSSGQIVIPTFYPGIYRYSLNYADGEQLTRMENIQGPVLYITLSSSTQVQEDFETDLSAWQTSGSWGRTSSQQHSGAYSLTDSPTGNYTNNVNSIAKLIQPINLQGVLNANVQFYAKTDISLDGDYCELAYSLTGSNWCYLAHFNGVTDWQLYTFSLNQFIGQQVYLRFKMSGNGWGPADGIYIDDFKVFTTSNATPVEDALLPAAGFTLSSYPNPFSQSLNLAVHNQSKNALPLSLRVYNLKGQLVKELYNAPMAQDKQVISWDGRDASANICANGIYLVRLSQQGRTLQTDKAVLLK
ncbi:MAG: M14 family zinc carboxypeptidase [Candidatus Cloacimonas sp.]|jgi:hypothetical protein|nr:M14 family zinc carboxypeptidase [Candidatus Cloacimonas sp.]